jgi:hypothetical protein
MADVLLLVNNNKYVWALGAMCVNLGSRFLVQDLTPMQVAIFSHPLFKQVVLFCIMFMVTRDVVVALGMALFASLLINYLLNEGSTFCIVPGARPPARVSNVTSSGVVAKGMAINHAVSSAMAGHA